MVRSPKRFIRWTTVALLLLLASPSGRTEAPSARASTTWAAGEDARLQAHFRAVLTVLSTRDVTGLPPEARSARARLIGELRAYASRGVFPRNEGHARGRTPVFVDKHGTRCAMAHLIEWTGHSALVARVAAEANLATIHALAHDPALADWLGRSGLSVAEAAMIQPSYPPYEDEQDPRENHRPDEPMMQAATITTAFVGGAAAVMNLNTRRPAHERRQIATLGIIAGGAGISVGIADWTSDGHLRGSGYFQLVAGSCSVAMSVLNLMSIDRPTPSRSQPQSLAESPPRRMRWSVVPGRDGEPQLAVTTRF